MVGWFRAFASIWDNPNRNAHGVPSLHQDSANTGSSNVVQHVFNTHSEALPQLGGPQQHVAPGRGQTLKYTLGDVGNQARPSRADSGASLSGVTDNSAAFVLTGLEAGKGQ